MDTYEHDSRSSPHAAVHQDQEQDDGHRPQRQLPEQRRPSMRGDGSITETLVQASNRGTHCMLRRRYLSSTCDRTWLVFFSIISLCVRMCA